MEHLIEVVGATKPEFLIGVGAYAETKLQAAAEAVGSEVKIGRILHPSPASPAANRGWAEAATKQLEALEVW